MKNFFKYCGLVLSSWLIFLLFLLKSFIFLIILFILIFGISLPQQGLIVFHKNANKIADYSLPNEPIVDDYSSNLNPIAKTDQFIQPADIGSAWEIKFITTLDNMQMETSFILFNEFGIPFDENLSISIKYNALNNSDLTINKKDEITKINLEAIHELFLKDIYKRSLYLLNDYYWGYDIINAKTLEKTIYKLNKNFNEFEYKNNAFCTK